MKIDWLKERTHRNLCGYCNTGSFTSSQCDGGCFTRKDYDPILIKKNKITHLLDQLKKVKQDRRALDKRHIDVSKELLKIKNSNPLPC